MKKIILITIIILSCVSCKKIFLGAEQENTPKNNFELFWQDFDKHYGLFEARDLNWDSIYAVYQPQVTPQTSDQELWIILREMIAYLDDSHTFIDSPIKSFLVDGDVEDFFASGSEGHARVRKEFSLKLLRSKYLEDVTVIPPDFENDTLLYGKIKNKDIGYIYFNDTGTDDLMDGILSNIGKYKAIIFDIRNNHGGDDDVAIKIAGKFVDDEELVYTVQERNGPEHGDFSKKKPYHSKPLEKLHFSKPVILLTDKITVSAADILALHLKSSDNVTQIGDSTAGDYSDISMERFLLNGWTYQYSIMMYLTPDGRSQDGIGSVPDAQIRNSVVDIQAGDDKVIEKAIQYLFDEYGIE